jgi:hypothetical protein
MVRAAGTVCSHYGVQKTRGDQGTLPPLCKTLAAVEFTIAAAVWKNYFITTGGNTIMHAASTELFNSGISIKLPL